MLEVGMDELEGEEDEEEFEQHENYTDDSIQTIEKHQGSVFCIDSFKNLIATGGEDDLGYVFSYDPETKKLDELIQTEKFKDSVTNVAFSCDGKYVAMCDMSGMIRVYILETKALHWSHDVENDIESLSWHPSCNVLFCSTAEGYFYMFKLSTSEIKLMYSGDDANLGCFKILKDGKRAICCYGNGNIRIWDLKTSLSTVNLQSTHEGDIIAVDLSSDGNLIATGGVDMKLQIINSTNGKVICNLDCSGKNKKEENEEKMEDEQGNSIESITFSKSLALVACATLSGMIYVWDLNTQTLRCRHDNKMVGYTKLVWHNQEHLYASTLDGSVQIFDGRNLELIKTLKGHKSEILDFCFNQDSSILYTASNDSLVKMFQLN